MSSSRERKYRSISDASNSDGGAGDPGDDGALSSITSSSTIGSACLLLPLPLLEDPSRWSRFRRAFTGCRSTLDAGPDVLASRGGTERTVKCSSVRV